jgi:hypothetical protein
VRAQRNSRRDGAASAATVEIDQLPDPAALAVDSLLAELGATDATVTVYRILAGSEQRGSRAPIEYLCKYPAEGFSLDVLRDSHDGGDFRLYINSGDGQIVKKLSVSVVRKQTAAIPAAPQAAPPGGDVVAVLREGFAQQAQLLREALRPAPALDLPALMTAAANMITTLRTVAQPAQALPAPAPDLLGRMDAMLSIFQKGLDIGRESAGGEDGGILSFARDLIRSPLAEAAAKQLAAGAAPVAAAPNPAPALPAAARPAPRQPTAEEQMKFYLAQLIREADQDADPVIIAAYILDKAPPAMVRSWTDRADWFDELCRHDPRVANYREWFEELHADLVQQRAAMSVDTNAGLTGDPDGGTSAPDVPGSA